MINSQNNNKDALALSNQKIDNLTKRQFLYTANFAINNASYEVSPYIAVSELLDLKYLLDTVYKSLDKRILSSKYAIRLKDIANFNKILNLFEKMQGDFNLDLVTLNLDFRK